MWPLAEVMISALVDTFRKAPRIRRGATVTAMIVVSLSAITVLIKQIYFRDAFSGILIVPVVLGAGAFITLFCVLVSYSEVTVPTLSNQLAPIHAERAELEEKIKEESTDKDVYSSLELNLNHLSEYYTINKSQARASFRMGAFAVILGLLVILAGVGLLYYRGEDQLTVATVSAIAGLIGQFIGVSCFYLYKKSQDQSNKFYEGLTRIQGTMLAVRLCEQIHDEKQQDQTRQNLIYKLAAPEVQTASAPTVDQH